MSRDLARIETNLKLKFNLEDAKVKPFDGSKLEAFFKEMEFKTLINKVASISGDMNITAPAPVVRMTKSKDGQMSMFSNEPQVVKVETTSTIEVIIVDTEETLKSLAKELGKAKVIAFDTETTGTEEMEADLVGISLSVKAGQGYYIPVGHSSGNNLQIKKVIEAITPAMTNPKIGKVAHNAKYDYIVLRRYGLDISPLSFDTMLAEFIVDPSSKNLGLKNLSAFHLGEKMTHIEELIGKGKKQISMAEVAIESVANYDAADA